MDLTNPATLRDILSRRGFTFSKALGQNFLIDGSVPERIAAQCGADEESFVLEIGPGVGCLTRELCARAGRVLAVELDERLRPVHGETLADCANLTLLYGDVMKLDLKELVEHNAGGLRPLVAANLPYNITTPVLTRLLTARLFSAVTVMVQREVAERMAAAPGSGDYGAFTLLCQYYAVPELLFRVPASAFQPMPKVESAVVRLTCREKPPVATPEAHFFRVVRAAFNQRRKTLVNALSSGFPERSKEELRQAVLAAGLEERVRGEALSLSEFDAVASKISP